MIPLLGLILGLIIGILIPYNIPKEYSNYAAVAILAALDSVFGGLAASMNNNFKIKVFLSGFSEIPFCCIVGLYWRQAGISLHLAAVFAFGNRIFLNFGLIRRKLIENAENRRAMLDFKAH